MGSYRVESNYQAELFKASPESDSQWYAVRVRSNFEKIVGAALRSKGYEELLPLYKARRMWSDRIKVIETPLFPGYVFCRFDPSRRLPILTTPGVTGIVGFGEAPAPVYEHEIDSLRTMLDAGLNCEPWPFLKVGQPITIEQGPLAGVDGTVLQLKGQYHLIVKISLLQRSVAAEVDRESVRPLTWAGAAASWCGGGGYGVGRDR
jgi:transcription antitermination factor NusG